jgi:hypothetical protein
MQQSLAHMASSEPELAAKLVVQALPAAATPIKGRLDYRLVISDVGSYHVSISDGRATVSELIDGAEGDEKVDFELSTDARTFVGLATGESQVRAVLNRRLRLRGKRWRALRLRKLETEVTMRDVALAGVDPDLLYRAMRYAIEPDWTKGRGEV